MKYTLLALLLTVSCMPVKHEGTKSLTSSMASVSNSSITNVEKIPVDPSMISLDPGGQGDPGLLFDEQDYVGDPLNGSITEPKTNWSTKYGAQVNKATLDLGAVYEIKHVMIYDSNNDVPFIVSSGTPGNFTQLLIEPADRYKIWKRHDVSVKTRYLQFNNTTGYGGIPEVVLYGTLDTPSESERIIVDIGADNTQDTYANNVVSQGAVIDLESDQHSPTGAKIVVTGFNSVNPNGTTAPASSLGLSSAITRDSFFGNDTLFDGKIAPKGLVKVSGLNSSTNYKLSLFASRTGVSNNRQTKYTAKGSSQKIAYLDVHNNTSRIAVIDGIKPNAQGIITIDVEKGPSNNDGNGFFYLGGLVIESGSTTTPPPPPAPVDNVAPVITLNGPASIELEVGNNYVDQGAKANDNVDGDITSKIVVTNSVNVNTAGTYYVRYNVKDAAGNSAAEVRRTVVVKAKAPPVISKIAVTPSMVKLEDGSGDPGLLFDEQALVGDPLNGQKSDPVSTWASKYGSMVNKAYVDLGQEYQISHIMLYDRNGEDGDFIISSGSPGNFSHLTTEPGNRYQIWKRHDVNVKTRYLQFVNTTGFLGIPEVVLYGYKTSGSTPNPPPTPPADTTPPVITLIGQAVVEMIAGNNYVDQGATATDNVDGNITSKIIVTNGVKSNIPGTYLVKYNVKDAAGNNAAQVQRTVIVNEPKPADDVALIPVDVDKIILEFGKSGHDRSSGNPKLLFDEQHKIKDLLNGTGPTNFSTTWVRTGGQGVNYAYVDLGGEYNISHIFLFDGNGQGNFSVSRGSPGNWIEMFTDNGKETNVWKRHDVSITTRYLRFKNHSNADFKEVALYGQLVDHNQAPELKYIPDVTKRAGESYKVQLSAYDINNDKIEFSASSLPSFASLVDNNNGTGYIQFDPTSSHEDKHYDISVTATDAYGASTSRSFRFYVFKNATGGVQVGKPLGTTSAPYGFHEYLPQGYDPKGSKLYPVIIYLHGKGEMGSTDSQGKCTGNFDKVHWQGLPKMLKNGSRSLPAIVISPQTCVWWENANVDKMVEYVKANYKVDPKRFYMTGISMGGGGTWSYAIAYPSKLTAILPICGARNYTSGASNLRGMPIWAFHSVNDGTVNVSETINLIDAIVGSGSVMAAYEGHTPGKSGDYTASALGANWSWFEGKNSSNGVPLMTIYPDYSHDSWTRTYENDAVWAWLLAQKKN